MTRCIIIFLMSFFLSIATSICNAKMVSISKKKVNMRSGPGKKYDVIWEIEKDYPLMILKSRGKWLKVKDYENDEGWIYQPLTYKRPYLIVKNKKVNIRSGPGKGYKIIATAEKGEVFLKLKQKNSWVKVEQDGFTGWIHRNLLWGWKNL